MLTFAYLSVCFVALEFILNLAHEERREYFEDQIDKRQQRYDNVYRIIDESKWYNGVC